jgi:hypothetical protein
MVVVIGEPHDRGIGLRRHPLKERFYP